MGRNRENSFGGMAGVRRFSGRHPGGYRTRPARNGFFPDTTFLIVHVLVACIVSAAAGFLAASVAGEKARAPLALGFMLLAMGLAKAYMSWPLVPLWYHVIFAAILLPMAILGGRFYSSN
jgi:heme A synthase